MEILELDHIWGKNDSVIKIVIEEDPLEKLPLRRSGIFCEEECKTVN